MSLGLWPFNPVQPTLDRKRGRQHIKEKTWVAPGNTLPECCWLGSTTDLPSAFQSLWGSQRLGSPAAPGCGGTGKRRYVALNRTMRKSAFVSSSSAHAPSFSERKEHVLNRYVLNCFQTELPLNSTYLEFNNLVLFSFVFILLWLFMDGKWCNFSTYHGKIKFPFKISFFFKI